ncbi:50S ribosomal protein L17 [Patescibacteria group bacterium]|nr:50S ribosomal protein L17 [Patescibacteria group bacterium]
MNHHKATRKFGRVKKVRDALMKSLALSLVVNGKIKTTDAKARELRPLIEKMITQGREGTVASRRALITKIGIIGAEKLAKDISPKYKERAGGYTRITKLPARISDGSLMAIIELV